MTQAAATDWFVYVLISETKNRTYVGSTVDVERRLLEHNGERTGGAKSTRSARPWRVGTTYGPYASRSEALRVEARVKQLRGVQRLNWKSSNL